MAKIPKNQSPIRDYVQYMLKQRGLTQYDAAEAIGITPQTLSRKLGNPQTFLINELFLLCKFSGIDPMTIMTALADSRRRKLEVTLSA